MSDAVNTLDLTELVTGGYLQEANRLFFHPLGLALMVVWDESTETAHDLRIVDRREDPEGYYFAPGVLSEDKVEKIRHEWYARAEVRVRDLGWVIQRPPPDDDPAEHVACEYVPSGTPAQVDAFEEWIWEGVSSRWIVPYCHTHGPEVGPPPMTREEAEAFEEGLDPCIPVVRVWGPGGPPDA